MSDTISDQEKLLKIISKAILGGWDRDIAAGFVQIIPDMFTDEYPEAKDSMVRSVLLDHGFAKAYFGELATSDIPQSYIAWKHHLQQAVIADDIINYYYQHI